jgi:PPOX class probable F420-dependent enzyme
MPGGHTGGVSFDPADLPAEVLAFARERHLATLTTLRPDGSPHVTPVGFTWDPDAGLVRIITFAPARKVRNLTAAAARGGVPRAVVCQVEGGRWLAFEGPATVTDDADRVAEAVRRYAGRYRQPGEREDRVAIEIAVDRITGRA